MKSKNWLDACPLFLWNSQQIVCRSVLVMPAVATEDFCFCLTSKVYQCIIFLLSEVFFFSHYQVTSGLFQPYYCICGLVGIPRPLPDLEYSLFFCLYLQILILIKLCTTCMLGGLHYCVNNATLENKWSVLEWCKTCISVRKIFAMSTDGN